MSENDIQGWTVQDNDVNDDARPEEAPIDYTAATPEGDGWTAQHAYREAVLDEDAEVDEDPIELTHVETVLTTEADEPIPPIEPQVEVAEDDIAAELAEVAAEVDEPVLKDDASEPAAE